MAEPSRYNISDEQAGISGKILKNKFGLTDEKELGDRETLLLKDAYNFFLKQFQNKKIQFNVDLLFKIHKYFLDPLYDWAGKIRTVDISKGNVLFAPAKYISNALKEFEKILKSNLPDKKTSKKELARKLALIHCEFNAIHPFREGNGRVIRLFLDLLAIDQGYLPIDFSLSSRNEYIKACIFGMKKEYKKMQNIIYKGLKK